MYRDDHQALLLRVEQLSKESETNAALRAEVLELRRQLSRQPAGNPYAMTSLAALGPGEQVALGAHGLERFPLLPLALLHLVTFGLSSLIHFGRQHGRLPHVLDNDPTTGEAIGYQFIPAFNLYWLFFAPLRLCDRINLQLKLRGLDGRAPYGLVLAAAVLTVMPWLGILAIPTLWLAASCVTQHRINQLADLGPLALAADEPSPLLGP